MRILIHDFGAYAFSVQLSRELASRGHLVRYVYLDETGSVRGEVGVQATDPPTFSSIGIADDDPKRRSSFIRRLFHDGRYAFKLSQETRAFAPDLVLSADCPLLSQAALQRTTQATGGRFVFWLQDLFGEALDAVVSRKSKVLAKILSAPFKKLERLILRQSDEVIGIAPAFIDYVIELGIDPDTTHLLPNWAPFSAQSNDLQPWKQNDLLPNGPRLLYSGTLGLKHDPQVLATIASGLNEHPGAHIVVVTEGEGRRWLEIAKTEESLDRLFLLDFQDAAEIPSMLDSADALIAILNADASVFSVPSKVLTYMTSGKPILAVIPEENYSSQLVINAEAGIVVPPTKHLEASHAAQLLLRDEFSRQRLGQNGLAFAAKHFDIGTIGDRVELICGLVDVRTDQRENTADVEDIGQMAQ